jgi:hypothetical protein
MFLLYDCCGMCVFPLPRIICRSCLFQTLGAEHPKSLGQHHVNVALKLRLSFWQQLPWILFGIAHYLVEVARGCARRAMRLFAGTPDDVELHPLAVIMCTPGTVCGEQLALFASGQRSLAELPTLQVWAAKFKFGPIAERWVEGLHSLTAHYLATAPHATATHVAYHGIQVPLRSRLSTTPHGIKQLAEYCAACRNPVKCLKAVGLWHHPAVVDLRRRVRYGLLNRHHSPALTEIIYHVDAWSLHAPLPAVPADSDDDGDDDQGEGGGGGGGGGGGAGGGKGPGGRAPKDPNTHSHGKNPPGDGPHDSGDPPATSAAACSSGAGSSNSTHQAGGVASSSSSAGPAKSHGASGGDGPGDGEDPGGAIGERIAWKM